MSLKSIGDLKRLYAKFDPAKETIVYCQSGARASETAGVLQELGFTKVKVYNSSWLGYGNTLDAPAENVTSSTWVYSRRECRRAGPHQPARKGARGDEGAQATGPHVEVRGHSVM